MARLRAQKYDIGIAEAFFFSELGLALFQLLGVPRMVVTTAMTPSPELFYNVGLLGRIKQANVPFWHGTILGDHRKEQRRERAEEIWAGMVADVSQQQSRYIDLVHGIFFFIFRNILFDFYRI